MGRISLDRVSKAYDGHATVHALDLDIADREFIVVVGPSGCGKSTTLRMIAGLEDVTSGEIRIGDKVVNHLPARDRDISMVFQNYALYPHMSVFENIAFGLELRNTPKEEIRRRVAEAARILDLTPLLERKPRALSGGQRQRVAMGRAIVRHPRAFLFDEPLSNLDAKLRMHMRGEIKRVHQTVQTTTVYVTHDQVEAMTLADRVVVMNAGRIEQVAPPQELYSNPKTRFVAGFIGNPGMNILPAQLTSAGYRLTVQVEDGPPLRIPSTRAPRYAAHAGKRVLLGLRPEHLTDQRPEHGSTPAILRAPVQFVEPMGMETLVHINIGGSEAIARCRPDVRIRAGETITLVADMDHAHVIDPATDLVL